MNRKIIIISMLSLFIIIFLNGCNKVESKKDSLVSINKSDLKPISKESAINILKAEYGDNILIKESDIKIVGDLYFIDVFVDVEAMENNEEHNEEGHNHDSVESIGTKKIDKYTGEIIQE